MNGGLIGEYTTADDHKARFYRAILTAPRRPGVVDQIARAKTPQEVHDLVSVHLADRASKRARRLQHQVAEARLAQLRLEAGLERAGTAFLLGGFGGAGIYLKGLYRALPEPWSGEERRHR